jgi:hypothetical protein
MRKQFIVAAFAAAACEQPTAVKAESEPPPSQREQAREAGDADLSDLAIQQITANTALSPRCEVVNSVWDMGVIAPDVAPGSLYASHVGAHALLVQCGQGHARPRPEDHWLVAIRPGAETQFVHCADASGSDRCAFPASAEQAQR